MQINPHKVILENAQLTSRNNHVYIVKGVATLTELAASRLLGVIHGHCTACASQIHFLVKVCLSKLERLQNSSSRING